MAGALGIVAGGGELPLAVIQNCLAQGREICVIGFEGAADPADFTDIPIEIFRMGAIGGIMKKFQKAGVEEIIMAGDVRRPSMANLRPDLVGAKLLAKLGSKILGGDDSLLSHVILFLEQEGFRVVGIPDIAPELLVEEGVLGKHKPSSSVMEDIEHGMNRAKALGELDIGQAVVVYNKATLAAEALEGTAKMLSRVADVRHDAAGGALVKCCKPKQELRADLPTIGTKTIAQAKEAGLNAIAIEADKSILLDRKATISAANDANIALIGMRYDG